MILSLASKKTEAYTLFGIFSTFAGTFSIMIPPQMLQITMSKQTNKNQFLHNAQFSSKMNISLFIYLQYNSYNMALNKYFNQKKNNFSSSCKTRCFIVSAHSLKINMGRRRRKERRQRRKRKSVELSSIPGN